MESSSQLPLAKEIPFLVTWPDKKKRTRFSRPKTAICMAALHCKWFCTLEHNLTWLTNNGPITLVLYPLIMSSTFTVLRSTSLKMPALFIKRFSPEPFRWFSTHAAASLMSAGLVASAKKAVVKNGAKCRCENWRIMDYKTKCERTYPASQSQGLGVWLPKSSIALKDRNKNEEKMTR